jgi:hypothetical protein
VNCAVRPAATEGVCVETAIEVRVGAEVPLLQPASSAASVNAKTNTKFFMEKGLNFIDLLNAKVR